MHVYKFYFKVHVHYLFCIRFLVFLMYRFNVVNQTIILFFCLFFLTFLFLVIFVVAFFSCFGTILDYIFRSLDGRGQQAITIFFFIMTLLNVPFVNS